MRPRLLFLGLAAATGLACALLAARVLRTNSFAYLFLPYNLALAWIPMGLSSLAQYLARRRPLLALPVGVAWWAFFPNAFYLVTDLVHFRGRPNVPEWYDVALLVAFAWCGTLLALASLGRMHALVAARGGRLAGWVFALLACLSTGLGIWLGRVLRYNSWDAALHPIAVLQDVVAALLHPPLAWSAWGVTLAFGGILMVLYVTVRFIGPAGRPCRCEAREPAAQP
jgi:uncharacterized membrane protein